MGFYLSHQRPVPVPIESAAAYEGQLLSRTEVVIVRDVFNFCVAESNFRMVYKELENHLGKTKLSLKLWEKLQPAMAKTAEERTRAIRPELFSFLRKMSRQSIPSAQLRMFENWLREYDSLAKKRHTLGEAQESMARLKQQSALPVLPPNEVARLE